MLERTAILASPHLELAWLGSDDTCAFIQSWIFGGGRAGRDGRGSVSGRGRVIANGGSSIPSDPHESHHAESLVVIEKTIRVYLRGAAAGNYAR